ncbi:MAG TPA: hypothetical protein VLT51_05155 [Anaerolineales bacterium]|nr:hypothetical protein [Anaerolineales bacterium]
MKSNVRIVMTVAGLVLASLACSLSGSGALLEDDFSGSDTNWDTGTDADSSVEYLNETLNFFVNKDFWFVWSTPNDETYENIHIEVTAKNDSTDPTGTFGIVCNLQVTDTSYYFAVTGAGEYAIGRYTLTDDVLLTNGGEWGTSDAITPEAASYRIGADCGNGTLTLYVDGRQVDSVSDTTYTSGNVGLFAWSGEQLDGTKVSFDDFVVTKLP